MSSATAELGTIPLSIDQGWISGVVESVESALEMCGVTCKCVGLSSVPCKELGSITGMIGVHGKVSGFVTINLSERLAIEAVEGLLQDKFGELTNQVVDGAGEITNIIVGGIKASFASTGWAFSNITVPSVIVGQGYHIAYAQGLQFLSATFEQTGSDAVLLDDRLLQVSISLLRL